MDDGSVLFSAKTAYQSIQNKKPLILNLTNQVTMQWVANVELAVGASPIMSVCKNEFKEILQYASALYINIGMLHEAFIEDCLLAAKIAKQVNIPIILDPVGCGFTQLRTNAALKLLPYADVVRGNASEVEALCKCHPSPKSKISTLPQGEGMSYSKGVDATTSVSAVKVQALKIAELYRCVCVVTGKEDFICSVNQSVTLDYGSGLMTKITGMGCALGAVLAAFMAISEDIYQASLAAILFYTLSAQAVGHQHTLGQFSAYFIDALNSPNWESLQNIFHKGEGL